MEKKPENKNVFEILGQKLTTDNVKKGVSYLSQYGMKQFGAKLVGQLQRESIDYEAYKAQHEPDERRLEEQRRVSFAYNPVVSIIVPIYKTPENFLREMIESVLKQTYKYVELCIADGSGSDDTETEEIVSFYARNDGRVKYKKLEENLGISGNTNEALKMAMGHYIGLLDHDDFLAPNAVFEVVKMINREKPDAVYTDEDKTTTNGERFFEPHFKPDFDLDLLRSNNYICHFFVVKKEIADRVGGFRPEFDGSQDYDFIFRCLELSNTIRHIPKILYHWRVHSNSVADNPSSKMYAYDAGKRAIEEHLLRLHMDAKVTNATNLGYYRVKYEMQEDPLVSIVVRDMNKPGNYQKAVKIISNNTSYTNYEIIKEAQLFRAKGEYILFYNADLVPLDKDWLMELTSHCARREVGIVGGKIYKGGEIYRACTMINEKNETKKLLWAGKNAVTNEGFADGEIVQETQMFTKLARWNQGYFCKAIIQQQTDAVSSLCLMVKKSLYFDNGGFNRALEKGFVSIDFCLRTKKAGFKIVFDPYAEFELRES
ncbi:glycosyltransferase [Konateibacter massiliensis]|uniref:glycosyltransferase n=1 Tax=Konateibacter massiliensis TaxID=2002841 RepID=UPI00117A818F|nr:glycosyltransferase [Konateibacter massiliensis]